jgi:hypothetical protein
MAKPTKDAVLNLRLTEEQLNKLKERAEEQEKSVSELIRQELKIERVVRY